MVFRVGGARSTWSRISLRKNEGGSVNLAFYDVSTRFIVVFPLDTQLGDSQVDCLMTTFLDIGDLSSRVQTTFAFSLDYRLLLLKSILLSSTRNRDDIGERYREICSVLSRKCCLLIHLLLCLILCILLGFLLNNIKCLFPDKKFYMFLMANLPLKIRTQFPPLIVPGKVPTATRVKVFRRAARREILIQLRET